MSISKKKMEWSNMVRSFRDYLSWKKGKAVSRKTLAELVGVHWQSITNWESGKSAETVHKSMMMIEMKKSGFLDWMENNMKGVE